MYQIIILDDKEIDSFNKKHNTNYKSIQVKQKRNKFFIVLDCDETIELTKEEALNYFI